MKEKDNKQCLLDTLPAPLSPHSTPPQKVMVSKENYNYYGEYKGHTKWLSLISSHFAKNIFLAWHFFMHMLIISVSCGYQCIRKIWLNSIIVCSSYSGKNKILQIKNHKGQ